MAMGTRHTHLNLEERRQIFLLVNSKAPVQRIAELLGRHHSTVYRELARNTTYHEEPFLRGYFHMNADYFTRQRRQRLRRLDRKSTRLNSSHLGISYAVFCLKKKK